MPSERQLRANRKNAALGGPKTEAGRAAVRFNAVTHGLAAATTVMPGEDPKAFDQLREDLFQDYLPATHTERMLFEDFVCCSWRLLRLRRVETEMWSAYIIGLRRREGQHEQPTQQEADRALAGVLAELPPNNLANFFRFERTITRDFYRAMHELNAAQRERRRGQPLPASQPAEEMQNEPEQHAAAAGASAASCSQSTENTTAQLSGNGIGTVLSVVPSATSPTTQIPQAPESDPTDTDYPRCA